MFTPPPSRSHGGSEGHTRGENSPLTNEQDVHESCSVRRPVIALLCSNHTLAFSSPSFMTRSDFPAPPPHHVQHGGGGSLTATVADEIIFQEGDVIRVTEMEDDSCWFTAEIRGKRGYVPENYISLLPYPWFAGRVSRLEAEKRLRWQDAGVFLVRESESAPGEFSVSVSYGEKVEHFRVLEGAGRYCIWEESFCSLNRLVDFYRTHSIAVETVIYLRDPPPSPRLLPGPEPNPYPNPYESSSPEAHPHSRPPHPERESSPRPLEPAVGKPRLGHALCDYTPPQSSHLHFLRGDVIDLLDCSSSLSWRGRCRGRVGVFPPEYVQPLYY